MLFYYPYLDARPPVARIPCWCYLKKIQGLLHSPLPVWRGEDQRDEAFLQKPALYYRFKYVSLLQIIAQIAAVI